MTSSLTTSNTNSGRYNEEEYDSDSYSISKESDGDYDESDGDYSETNDNSEYDSASDWHPDNY